MTQTKLEQRAVRCTLCPKTCTVAPGESGECRIRVNVDGELLAITHGFPCAVHLDPIEKKPLFHMHPGSQILSIATVGCNLHCKNCQNWQISQANPEDTEAYHLGPDQLVALAKQKQCTSIAYTYTDPVVYYEYALDSAVAAQEAGLKNVLVTAGYINAAPWRALCAQVDAANIDLKSMSDQFYRDVCGASLKPVLQALTLAQNAGVLVEVTFLIIPTLNDSEAETRRMSRWIKENMGAHTPLHLSAFYPAHKMQNLPPTPPSTLRRAREIALTEGLHFVYTGNILDPESENTYCPHCKALVIERSRYTIIQNRLHHSYCTNCSKEVYGIWH